MTISSAGEGGSFTIIYADNDGLGDVPLAVANNSASGSFLFGSSDYVLNKFYSFSGVFTSFYVYGEVAGYKPPTFASAPVPEAATWGMMIAGFGMMGAAMRTRRRSTKVSFA